METIKKIYILHGWSYQTEIWKPFLQGLTDLGFSPIFLRIPGLTGPIDREWNLDDYVTWLASEIEKETEPIVLLGHSNGGRISIAFAKKYPLKVKGLILVDSAGVYHNDFKIRFKRAFFAILANVGGFLKHNKTIRLLFYKIIGERDYHNANETMRKTMTNLISVDLTPIFSEISCPVGIVWGNNDTYTPLSDGKLMAQLFPHNELTIIDGARHSPQFTHQDKVLNAVKKYYEKNNF